MQYSLENKDLCEENGETANRTGIYIYCIYNDVFMHISMSFECIFAATMYTPILKCYSVGLGTISYGVSNIVCRNIFGVEYFYQVSFGLPNV